MDTRQLKQLDQFLAFFDLMTEPEKFKQLIKEANEAVAAYEETVVKGRGIRDVDEYRARVSVELDKKEATLREYEKAIKARQIEHDLRVSEDQKRLADRFRELEEKRKEVADLEKLRKLAAAEQEVIEGEREELNERYQKLIEKEKALEAKTKALEALMKGT